MGAGWFALKDVPDLGEGSLGMWGGLSKGLVVVCSQPHPPVTQAKALVSGIYLLSTIETL